MGPMPSWVYVLCLDPPREIGEADVPQGAVISHYVGWTQQDWPMHRTGGHKGAGMATCVLLITERWPTKRNSRHTDAARAAAGAWNYRAEAARAARRRRAAVVSAPDPPDMP